MDEEKVISSEEINEIFKKSYFVIAENSFINNPAYTVTEKMVYLCLCTYAGKNVSCFPGQTGIAKALGITSRTVIDVIKSLEKKNGLIVVKQITESKRRTTNQYILADIDKETGFFDKKSLKEYECFKGNVIRIKGK